MLSNVPFGDVSVSDMVSLLEEKENEEAREVAVATPFDFIAGRKLKTHEVWPGCLNSTSAVSCKPIAVIVKREEVNEMHQPV